MSLRDDIQFFLDETEIRLRDLSEKTKHNLVGTGTFKRHAPPGDLCHRCEIGKMSDRAADLAVRLRKEDL